MQGLQCTYSYEFNFKLLTPSFLPDVHKVVVPDYDSIDAKAVKRWLSFLQNLRQNPRKFCQDVLGGLCARGNQRAASKK
jgi:hypothetical protein